MSQDAWSETELEKGSGAFVKAAAALPGRMVSVNNGKVSAGGINVSITSTLFQKLIKAGWIRPCALGYEVTDIGVYFVRDWN